MAGGRPGAGQGAARGWPGGGWGAAGAAGAARGGRASQGPGTRPKSVKSMILAGTVRYFGENTLKTPKLSHKIEIWAEKLAAPLWSSSDFTTKKCDFVRSGMKKLRGQIFVLSWQLRGLIQKV